MNIIILAQQSGPGACEIVGNCGILPDTGGSIPMLIILVGGLIVLSGIALLRR